MLRVFIHPEGVALHATLLQSRPAHKQVDSSSAPGFRSAIPAQNSKNLFYFVLIEKPIAADIEYYALGCNSCFTFPGWHL